MVVEASFTHNIEVAHRLSLQPGKCQQIHGHSMKVTMTVAGEVDDQGILGGVDFGEIKKMFREYLDRNYDHQLLLNHLDPWASPAVVQEMSVSLPGLVPCPADPTTENLATWVFEDLNNTLIGLALIVTEVHIQETPSNSVSCKAGF